MDLPSLLSMLKARGFNTDESLYKLNVISKLHSLDIGYIPLQKPLYTAFDRPLNLPWQSSTLAVFSYRSSRSLTMKPEDRSYLLEKMKSEFVLTYLPHKIGKVHIEDLTLWCRGQGTVWSTINRGSWLELAAVHRQLACLWRLLISNAMMHPKSVRDATKTLAVVTPPASFRAHWQLFIT